MQPVILESNAGLVSVGTSETEELVRRRLGRKAKKRALKKRGSSRKMPKKTARAAVGGGQKHTRRSFRSGGRPWRAKAVGKY